MGKKTASGFAKTKWSFVIFSTLCLISWGGRVFARDARPCDDDVAKFCKDVQAGRGGVIKCLKDHENDVSSGCKQDLSKMQSKAPAFLEACRDDISKLCEDIKPGGGRIVQCLKSHENELSSQCKAGLPSRGERSGKNRPEKPEDNMDRHFPDER